MWQPLYHSCWSEKLATTKPKIRKRPAWLQLSTTKARHYHAAYNCIIITHINCRHSCIAILCSFNTKSQYSWCKYSVPYFKVLYLLNTTLTSACPSWISNFATVHQHSIVVWYSYWSITTMLVNVAIKADMQHVLKVWVWPQKCRVISALKFSSTYRRLTSVLVTSA